VTRDAMLKRVKFDAPFLMKINYKEYSASKTEEQLYQKILKTQDLNELHLYLLKYKYSVPSEEIKKYYPQFDI
jgi:hypothetical protein